MREGSLEAPKRHPIAWQDPDFYDADKLDAELRRVFDICHICRRCFNLCESFPRLFDLIDAATTGELNSVDSAGFAPVVEACTLCDMCFMTKCPYVPPHAFDVDFPHLMLRARAVATRAHKPPLAEREMAATDRNGRLAGLAAGVVNWATGVSNTRMRAVMERHAGLHHEAVLPRYASHGFTAKAAGTPELNRAAPAFGRKVVLYSTCFVTFNEPGVGLAARAVLARNGVATEVVYPRCCGMPLLEQGRIAEVAENARAVSRELAGWIERGYDVVALVPSCALMLKFEWPLILPDDAAVKRLAAATYDLSEYVVDIARKEGMAPGMQKVAGTIVVHIACHARAQNMGQKAAELLRLLPEAELQVIERCSGHGGAWGFRTENFPVALKVGRPVARQARDGDILTSECPLAGEHIVQGVERLGGEKRPELVTHPIQLIARAYGITA
jgi:glycerol-3-phosphate dehydrogenase subunit C